MVLIKDLIKTNHKLGWASVILSHWTYTRVLFTLFRPYGVLFFIYFYFIFYYYSLYNNYFGLTKVVLELAGIQHESTKRTETATKPTNPAPVSNHRNVFVFCYWYNIDLLVLVLQYSILKTALRNLFFVDSEHIQGWPLVIYREDMPWKVQCHWPERWRR